MTPITPDGPEENQMHVFVPLSVDANNVTTTEWVPSDDERDRLICGGIIRFSIYPFVPNEMAFPVTVEVSLPCDDVVKES